MIPRILTEKVQYLAKKYPVVTLTGTRQCGKSTLLKYAFPDYRYVSLEDLDLRTMAKDDPRGFLQNFGSKMIIDEAQYVPELFSYIQTKVDAENEAAISVPTANAWLSLLESSYVIYLLKPYHNNYNKRLVKSPKLYFYDTGLVSSLLGLESAEQLATHYLRGEIFETMVISEIIKQHFFVGKEPPIYFWQDSNKNEVDLLIEKADGLQAVDIKTAATMKNDFFKTLQLFQSYSDISTDNLSVVYGGDTDYVTKKGKFISWKNL